MPHYQPIFIRAHLSRNRGEMPHYSYENQMDSAPDVVRSESNLLPKVSMNSSSRDGKFIGINSTNRQRLIREFTTFDKMQFVKHLTKQFSQENHHHRQSEFHIFHKQTSFNILRSKKENLVRVQRVKEFDLFEEEDSFSWDQGLDNSFRSQSHHIPSPRGLAHF